MLQDLAALVPPVIVCVAFVAGAWFIVRKELAPRRRQTGGGPPSGAADSGTTGPDRTPAVRSSGDQDAS
jgi:hypothetical protein